MPQKSRPSKAASVDRSQVERLAELARLSLGPAEMEHLRVELSPILEYFAALDKVKIPPGLEGVEATNEGGLRDDTVRPSTPGAILEGVPQRKGRYVRAPRVF